MIHKVKLCANGQRSVSLVTKYKVHHTLYSFKVDLQSVLRTLERLFAFFVSFHLRHHK